LKFAELFRKRFMDINVAIPLEAALDLGWKTLAECFEPEQLLMKQELIDKYYPKDVAARARRAAGKGQAASETEATQEAPAHGEAAA
jgi:hypothetical protein